MEPLKPRDKVTQHMTRDGLTLDNQTTGESVNVSSREAEQEYTAQPEGAAEKMQCGTFLLPIPPWTDGFSFVPFHDALNKAGKYDI